MDISKIFASVAQYLSGAMARIFGPTDDAYPEIGVQPFSGDPFNQRESNW